MTTEPERLTINEITRRAFATPTTETATFAIEIRAGVDAVSSEHALMLVALDLLNKASFDEHGGGVPFGPTVPAGYVGFVDLDMREEGR